MIMTINESLKQKVLKGEITLNEASRELCRAGQFNFVESEKKTAQYLGIMKRVQRVDTKGECPEIIPINTIVVWRNWEQEGALNYKGDTTLKNYSTINRESSNHHFEGVFFAFDKLQFVEGMLEIGMIKELMQWEEVIEIAKGNVFSIGAGGYATREGYKSMLEYIEKKNERIIAECDPQEVYLDEYNNHECMIDWDGDDNAMAVCLQYWPVDVCKCITRYNENHSVEDINKRER